MVSVAWITERGDDVVRQRAATPLNISQRGYADTGEHRLRPADLATVIRQVSAFLKAWNWSLRPTRLTLVFDVPIATSTCAKYAYYSLTLCEFLPGRLQRLGTTPTPSDWTSSVTSPWRPEAFSSDVYVQPAAFIIFSVDYASGTPGLGLA